MRREIRRKEMRMMRKRLLNKRSQSPKERMRSLLLLLGKSLSVRINES
jgi:hypothetical protein